jgi:hypothetical protein
MLKTLDMVQNKPKKFRRFALKFSKISLNGEIPLNIFPKICRRYSHCGIKRLNFKIIHRLNSYYDTFKTLFYHFDTIFDLYSPKY